MKSHEIAINHLANGLQLAVNPMQETETVVLNVWVKSGSRFENQKNNGIAHFMEHMAFKGTARRSAAEIAIAFDDIGGSVNAHTSREHTVYHAKTLKEDWEIALDILADIIQNSAFDAEELERERQVILQEIAMTEDTPDDIVFDHYLATAYPDQPLGYSILGTTECVQSFKAEDFKNYLASQYSADRIVVSVAGAVENEKILRAVNEKFVAMPRFPVGVQQNANYCGGEFRAQKSLEQIQIVLGFKSASYQEQEKYKTQLLANMLGGSMSSRLFQEIREKRGLAYSIGAGQMSFDDSGIFTIHAGTNPEQAEILVKVTCEELKKATHDLTQSELDRARKQMLASWRMGVERASFRADEIGRQLCCFNRIIEIAEIESELADVSISNLHELAANLWQQPITVASLGDISSMPSLEEIQKYLT
jgi:predicted Zn-dependent peptidase